MNDSLVRRLTTWLRDNPFFWVLLAGVALYAAARYVPLGYITATGWITEPIYNPLTIGWSVINTSVAALPGYTYALVARAVVLPPHLTVWPSVAYGCGLLACLSGMIACLSFLSTFSLVDKIRFWLTAAAITATSAFLASDAAAGSTMAGQAIRIVIIIVNVGLYYYFSQIHTLTSLPLRFGLLLLGNLAWFAGLYVVGAGWQAYPIWAGYSAPVPTILTCLFAFQAAYFLPYGALLLAVRQNVNGLFAFLLILIFGAGNVLLGYLETRGIFHGALFVPDGLWLLALLALFGLEPYQKFVDEDSNWFSQPALAKPLFASWAGIAFCLLAWTHATENAPLTEVIEDASNLSVIGVSVGFLAFVLANFTTLLWQGQRVDRVLFNPFQLPISAVMVVGATAIWMFVVSNNKYTYYQAKAGMYNAVADGYFINKEYQSADLFYQESISNDFYNFHANYMLAQLAKAKGSESSASAYLRKAIYTKPRPEAYLELADLNRSDGAFIKKVLDLSEGHQRFPHDERITSNLLIAYLGSTLTDSVAKFSTELAAGHPSPLAETNLLAVSALGKLPESTPLPSSGPLANRYLGSKPRPDVCAALKSVADTASMQSMASFLGLYNALILCDWPQISYSHIDTLIEQVEPGYEEDLLYARAWSFWRTENRLQALEDMQRLARPGSLSAGVYYATAVAWAAELGNTPLARRLFTESAPQLSGSFNPIPVYDSIAPSLPYASIGEENRAAWIALHPLAFGPAELAGLLADFDDPVQQRAVVLASIRTSDNPLGYIQKCLPRLSPSEAPQVRSLDVLIAQDITQQLLAANLSLAGNMPKPWLDRLGLAGQTLVRLQAGKAEASDFALAVRAYPFSGPVLNLCIRAADKHPKLYQPLFEYVAEAYSVDNRNAAARKAYITLARILNLDSFAESAEAIPPAE